MSVPAKVGLTTKLVMTAIAAVSMGLAAGSFSSCGGDNGVADGGDAGDTDGTLVDGGDIDGNGGGDAQVPFCTDGGCNCLNFGAACKGNSDCCGQNCAGGVCSFPMCTSDNQTCSTNNECCSKICNANKCAPLNLQCKTLGNTCSANNDCCSKLCKGGICSPSSFCGQPGDVCASNGDCCTGICNKPNNQLLGTCNADPPGGPANCGQVDGVLCGGMVPDGGFLLNDAGLPACGGSCCSRNCSPYGVTGMMICQPASGCHVVGDLCKKDVDCCGSAGLPGGSGKPVTCVITAPFPVGICRNPQGCKPDGDICKLKTQSCNASCDCCAGNCQNLDTCHQDILGVPRCSGPCADAGGSCASSSNCCGKPCVPNPDGGTPPYICWPLTCVNCGGKCTVTADCCPGASCIIEQGSASGTCGPCADGGGGGVDGGCAEYGQVCNVSGDCCNGVPCTGGRCVVPLPN